MIERHIQGGRSMDSIAAVEGFELEIQIEELEAKTAPDGGETVLPLCPTLRP
jgi:hypothetical protein